ncbi:hypothetical protein HYPSUDRAFT_544294 [Hypholoma sublateritium FD-334 SS-4]|uniref:Uncharacterized protein n=1 Tax=Hypholoma sublateritium (strain FD-334 SS-4) TaxID=945553 RepID=A0A0D2PWY7_HYPSF|nr:hypothetical protein HYPSUDRAFT_544294 [Hypholoma sublateritium FD-334 SS-4]
MTQRRRRNMEKPRRRTADSRRAGFRREPQVLAILDSHAHAPRGQIAGHALTIPVPSKHDAEGPPDLRSVPGGCDTDTDMYAPPCVCGIIGLCSWRSALAPQYYVGRGSPPSNTCYAVAHRRNKQRACGCNAPPRVAAAPGRALGLLAAAWKDRK